MEETLAVQLEWRGNSSLCLRFESMVTVEETVGELRVHGVLAEQVLADPDSVEMWKLLCEGSPYFRLVLEDGSDFEVVLQTSGQSGGFSLREYLPGAQP